MYGRACPGSWTAPGSGPGENGANVRKYDNKLRLFNLIRNNSPLGRAQLAKETGLAMPTVMKIIHDFIDLGLVREVGKGKSTGGKPPTLLEFVHDSYFSVGVDLGATNIICVLMDASNIVSRTVIPTEFASGPERVLERILLAVETVLRTSGIDPEKLLGIGLAIPGLLDSRTGKIIFSPDIGWHDVDALAHLKRRFNTYVCVNNATRATALGEKTYGSAKEMRNYMCLNLGYGIGGAVVFDDEVYTGFSGSAGEIGHMTVIPDGPRCDCGNRGCLEAVSSARAMTRDARERLSAGEDSVLRDMVDGDLDKLEAKMVLSAADKGDRVAGEIAGHAISTLGIAIASIINLLDFEAIILEGGIARGGPYFFDKLVHAINSHKMRYAGRHTRILVSELGADATAIGAASLVINNLLEGGALMQSPARKSAHAI